MRSSYSEMGYVHRPYEPRSFFCTSGAKQRKRRYLQCTDEGKEITGTETGTGPQEGSNQSYSEHHLLPSFQSSATNLSEDWCSSVATLSFSGSMFFISHSSALQSTCRAAKCHKSERIIFSLFFIYFTLTFQESTKNVLKNEDFYCDVAVLHKPFHRRISCRKRYFTNNFRRTHRCWLITEKCLLSQKVDAMHCQYHRNTV